MAQKNGGELYKWHEELGWTFQVLPKTRGDLNKRRQELRCELNKWQVVPRTGGELYKWHEELGMNSTIVTKNWGELYKWHLVLEANSTSGTKKRG